MTPTTTIHPTANALDQTKSSGVQRGVVMPVALTLLTIFSAGTAQAVDYTWDPTSSDSATTEGAGNWDTTTTNWTTDVGATNEVGGTGSDPFNEDLIFGGGTLGTAGTVTLTETGNDYGSIEFLATNAGTYTIDLNGNEVELKRSGNTFLIGEDATITDIAGGGTLTLAGSRQFNFTDSSKTLSISAVIAGGGGTYSVGTGGTLDLSGVNTFTSALTLNNQSQLVISGAGQLGSGSYAGNITMNQGTDFTYASSAIQTLSGIISDDGTANGNNDVNMTGSGTLTLSGANTYTGVTNINAGTLVADVADVAATSGALGNGGNISFTGGTLQYGTGITQDYSARILNSTSAISVDTNGEDVTWGTALNGSNTGGLTKDGVGTLVIDAKGANAGVLTVNDGTLEISATVTGNSLSYTSYQINNGSTLFFNETTASNIVLALGSGDITFGSSVTGGTLQLFGNTIFRNQTITTTGGAKNFITGDRFNLQNTRNITFDTAVGTDVDGIDLEVSATISNGDIIKDGVGTVSITNSANNLGVVSGTPNTVTINAGTLEVGGAGRLQSGSYAGAITNAGIFKYNSTDDQTLSGVISGAGALTKDNTSTLTLSALNTYTGATTISDGTLEIGSAGKLGNGSYAGTIANDGILNYNSSATQTLNGIISGTGAIVLNGTGQLNLSANNSFTGGVTVNNGTLSLESGGIGDNGPLTVNGGLVSVSIHDSYDNLLVSELSGTGGLIDVSRRRLTVTQATDTTYAGVIQDVGGIISNGNGTAFTKAGVGTLTLTGDNTYSKNTTVSGGTLEVSGALYSAGTVTDTSLTIGAAGTLDVTGAGSLGLGAAFDKTIANSGTINYNSTTDQELSGVISGAGVLTKDNTSTLTLTGANTYSGATNINAGILRADVADVAATSGALGNSGDITFTGGTLQYTANSAGSDYSTRIKSSTSAMTFDTNGQNVTFATKFANTNTGGLTKLGAGELSVVLDSSSYTGLTKVDGGTLVLGNNTVNNTNTSSSGFEINNGSTLQFERGAQGILIGGKTFTFDSNGGGALEVNGSALLWRDNTIVTSGGLQNTFSGTAGVNVQNNLNNAGTQARFMTFDVADGSDEVDLLVSTNVANAKLIKNGAGTVALTSSANELTLATQTVTINAGTLEIGGAGRLNVGNYSQAITNDGTFKYNSSADQTLSGVISGSGALTQSGAGTLTLSGANTYTGATTVSAGILLINNTTGSGTGTGAVTVASGASLGGSGTISGATTIQSGGFLAPGNSPGILTFSGDLTLASGSFTNMEITGSTRGTDYDGIDVSGALTYGGTLTLTSNTLIGVGEYNLFDFTSESGDFSSITLSGTAYANNTFTQDGDVWDAIVDNQTYTYSQVTGNLVVATAAVPEPETFALLGGLLALTYVLGRRRRR